MNSQMMKTKGGAPKNANRANDMKLPSLGAQYVQQNQDQMEAANPATTLSKLGNPVQSNPSSPIPPIIYKK